LEHRLKTWPVYWDAVESGAKNFEVRRDDRGFQKGDILILHKFNPQNGLYELDYAKGCGAPKALRRRVTWILTGGQLGVEPGYVVMGLADDCSQ
jgi:hypothetical protein